MEHATQADLPDVFIDDNRIVQVLTNLISNALKFTEKGNRIMVTASNDLRCSDKIVVSAKNAVGVIPTGMGDDGASPEFHCRFSLRASRSAWKRLGVAAVTL